MSFLKEFKSFAVRGNVIDLAVGVIIGGAFGKIVSSLVDDVMMPIISVLTGKVDFSNLFFVLWRPHGVEQAFHTLKAAKAAGVTVLGYGLFINAVVQFTIVSFAIFLLIKQMNRLKKADAAAEARADAKAEAAAPPNRQEKLLQEIRDILKSR